MIWLAAISVAQLLGRVEETASVLRAERARVEAAYQEWRAAARVLWPRGGVQFAEAKQEGFFFGGFQQFPERFRWRSAGFFLQWTVYDPTARAEARLRFWEWQEARAQYEIKKEQLLLRIVRAVLLALRLREKAETLARDLDYLREAERIARAMLREGAATKMELLRVQAEREAREAEYDSTQQLLSTVIEDLRTTLHWEGPFPLPELAPLWKPPDLPGWRELLPEAYQRRPEFRILEAQEQRLALEETRVAGYPRIRFLLQELWLWSPHFPLDRQKSWSLQWEWLTLEPSRGALSSALQARRKALQAERQALRERVRLEVLRAYMDLQTALRTRTALRKALEAAREAERLAKLRYEAGAGRQLDWLDALRQRSNAEQALTEATYRAMEAQAALWRALGRPLRSLRLQPTGKASPEGP